MLPANEIKSAIKDCIEETYIKEGYTPKKQDTKPKTPIEVTLKCMTDGKMLPLFIKWQNGCIYEIERVIDIKPRGPYSVIYKVIINGKKHCLYYENKKWLVEAKG